MEDEILRTALAPDAGCLPVEHLGRYADGALGAEEQAAAAAHIRGCLSCQAELALLQAVTSSGVRPEEEQIVRESAARLDERLARNPIPGRVASSSSRPAFGFGAFRTATVAAVLLLATVAGGTYFLLNRQTADFPAGVTTGDEITRSLAVAVRGPVGNQAEPPQRLQWLPVEGAVRYRVRLMEVDRNELWSASTSEPGSDIPAEVRAGMAPGRTLLWDVTAYDTRDAIIAESGTQSFRIEQPGALP